MRNWLRKRKEDREAAKEAERARHKAKAAEERKREQEHLRLKSNVLAILDEGKLPEVSISVTGGTLPFKLLKSERLLWVFQGVEDLEDKMRREIRGRSSGMSVRVAKGVSVRVGPSRGTPVERRERVSHGTGLLGVATKNIYFRASTGKSVRIPFAKMVSVTKYADAVEVARDRASGLPEFFAVGRRDADFLHDLLHAIPASEVTAYSEAVPASQYHLLGTGDGDHYIEHHNTDQQE